MTNVYKALDSVSTGKAAAKFRKDAAAYTKRVTKSKAEARKTLVAIGTHQKDGKLTKNYREK